MHNWVVNANQSSTDLPRVSNQNGAVGRADLLFQRSRSHEVTALFRFYRPVCAADRLLLRYWSNQFM